MSKFRKKLNTLLALALSVLLLSTTTAFAAGDCRLQVIIENSAEEPVPNINVELLQVAVGEGAACALTPAFSGLGISAQELLSSPGIDYAEQIYQYIYAKELIGQIKHTSAHGTVHFNDLEKGIYLVFERGNQMVAFQPYLVILPSEINGHPETNVISIPKTSESDIRTLLVEKLWEDQMNAAGARPSYVNVTVLRDGVPFKSVTLREANAWLHVFYMLPESGTYTVEEEAITDYQAEYIPVAEGYLILNRYTGTPGGGGGGGGGTEPEPEPQKAHVSVRKVWDDEHDAAGKRPVSITVQLIEGGTVIQTASLSEANRWAYTFSNLDPAKSYTAQEIAVADYTAAYTGNASTGITITNTYSGETNPGTPPPPVIPEPELIRIPVIIKWVDQDNAAGKRPDMVAVHLLSGGSIISTIQVRPDDNQDAAVDVPPAENPGPNVQREAVPQALSLSLTLNSPAPAQEIVPPDNIWESAFNGVPADLSYSVWQSPVEHYTTTYDGNAAVGFIITNTYTEDITDPGVPPEPTLPTNPIAPPPAEPPDKPVGPTIPQTGAEVLPVYLLMAAGVLFVLLGIIDLYRGRKRP